MCVCVCVCVCACVRARVSTCVYVCACACVLYKSQSASDDLFWRGTRAKPIVTNTKLNVNHAVCLARLSQVRPNMTFQSQYAVVKVTVMWGSTYDLPSAVENMRRRMGNSKCDFHYNGKLLRPDATSFKAQRHFQQKPRECSTPGVQMGDVVTPQLSMFLALLRLTILRKLLSFIIVILKNVIVNKYFFLINRRISHNLLVFCLTESHEIPLNL